MSHSSELYFKMCPIREFSLLCCTVPVIFLFFCVFSAEQFHWLACSPPDPHFKTYTTCCCSHFLRSRSTNTSAPLQVPNKIKVGLWLHCVYGSARPSCLKIRHPILHALRLCLGNFRTSPAVSLCVQAAEPALALRHKKLSLQCCLKLSANANNPAYNAVFNSKFKT